jgi:hypothetical protein
MHGLLNVKFEFEMHKISSPAEHHLLKKNWALRIYLVHVALSLIQITASPYNVVLHRCLVFHSLIALGSGYLSLMASRPSICFQFRRDLRRTIQTCVQILKITILNDINFTSFYYLGQYYTFSKASR